MNKAGNITNELEKMFKDVPGFESVKATIKAKSPTTIIKFFDINKQEDYHRVLGCSLLLKEYDYRTISMNNRAWSIPSIVDVEDLNDNSIIYITDHQVIEVLNIFDGIYTLLLNNNNIDINTCKNISKIIISLSGFNTISELFEKTDEISNYLDSISNLNIRTKISSLITWIWFIPYGELDNIYQETVAQFNADQKKESGGDTDGE